jgi:hypothetical protein
MSELHHLHRHRPSSLPPVPGRRAQAQGPAVQRQFVNFTFYRLDPAFRRLGDHEKIQARSEFLRSSSSSAEG